MEPEQGNSIAEQGSAEPDSARGPLARHLPARFATARLASVGCAAAVLAAALAGTTASRGSLSRRSPRTAPSGPATSHLPPLVHGGRPTFVLFQSGTSSLEREFLAGLRETRPPREAVRVVLLNSLDSPSARRFAIRETPTLLAFAPGGREISRRTGPQAITAALAAAAPAPAAPGHPSAAVSSLAATCRVWRGPRLRWIEETDPQARRVYRRLGGGRLPVPDIFKAMSLRPELMEKVLDLSETGHFSDGYLDRRTKERIATYVSSLNGSHYCLGSHAAGLQSLGARSAEAAALARGDLDAASLSPRDRALFEFVRELTLHPGELKDEDVARLRRRGWRDEQIFEAAFDAALFAFFNRMAITYGLDYPPDGWQPPAQAVRTARRPSP